MKNNCYFILILAICSIMACTKEPEKTPSAIPGYLQFETSISDTKTVLEDGIHVLWCPSDKISVSGAEEAYTTNIGSNSATAVFSGEYVESINGFYYAAYPYEKVVSWNSGIVTMNLPNVQNAVPGTFENGLNINVSKCTEDIMSFRFRNVLGYICFTVDQNSGDIKSVKVSASETETISGTFTIDCQDVASAPVVVEGEGKNEVTLVSDGTLAPGNYYIAVLPGTFSNGLSFEFTDTEGKTAVKGYDSAKTVKSGHIYNVGTVSGLEWQTQTVYEGPIVVECENMVLGNDAVAVDDDSASEGRAADLQGNGGNITAQIDIPEDGVYRIDLRYKTGGTAASDKFNEISVNGMKRMVNFITTNQYEDLNMGVFELAKGQVEVGIHGYWGWSRCDKVTVTKVDTPAQIILDYNDATLGGDAAIENTDQIALKNGNVTFKANIPAAGYYKVRINSYNGNGDTKYNKVEVPGLMEGKSCEFAGIGAYQEFTAGTIYCDSPKEIEVRISAEWGWSYIQNVSLVPAENAGYNYITECESGLLENGAAIGGPGDQYGLTESQSVNLNTGKITMTTNIGVSGVYVMKIRHFTWSGGNKKQNVEITGILDKQEYEFSGSNSWSDLRVGKVYIPSGNITTIISSSWGYNYFDRISFEKVIY